MSLIRPVIRMYSTPSFALYHSPWSPVLKKPSASNDSAVT